MTSSWAKVLDQCDARLAPRRARAAPSWPPFTGVEVSEPLPSELVDRARAIVDRSGELEQRLRAEQDRLRSELRRLPRMPAAERQVHFEAKA